MSTPRIDDETLAAFLDARLSAEERARVSQALADDPEQYEEFLEAAHLVAELEGVHGEQEEAPRGVELDPANAPSPATPTPVTPKPGRSESVATPIPPQPKPNWRRRLFVAVPILAAAAIVGIMVQSRESGAVDTIALMQGIALASTSGPGSVQASLGDNWDQPGWSVVRGGESSSVSAGTVARLGARLAQLEYSAGARDSIAYDRSRARVRALLSTIEGSGPLAASLGAVAIAKSSERTTLARQIREISGRPTAFDVGAWLETTRLALASGRDDFVTPTSDALAALQHIVGALQRAPSEGGWVDIQRHLESIEQQPSNAAAVRAHVDSALAAIPR